MGDYLLDAFLVIGAVGICLMICGAIGCGFKKLPKLFPRFGRLMDKLGGEEDV